jgi:hypothetical protein
MQGAAPAVRVGGVVQWGGSRIGGAGKGRYTSVNPRVPDMCNGCGAVASAVAAGVCCGVDDSNCC